MAVIINATTTTGLTTSADNSGVIQFQSNGANTVGISSTGYLTIGGNQQIAGPAFSAYQSTKQTSISTTTWTKLVFQTKTFDTASCFDNTTNYRFTPNVPGYYQFVGGAAVATSATNIALSLYKNGSAAKNLFNSPANMYAAYGTTLIYMNGSTDYVELYIYLGSGQQVDNSDFNTYFAGSMVRGA